MKKSRSFSRKQQLRQARMRAGLALILVGLLILILATDRMLRPLILSYSTSAAKTTFVNIVNTAMKNVLDNNKINYSDIAVVSKDSDDTVSSIQIDTVKVNTIKTELANEIIKLMKQQEKLKISIPLGTIIGNEYSLGRGPNVKFELKMSNTVRTDLQSKFSDAGINQTLHQISLNVTSEIYIVMPWYRTGSSVSTNYTLAETVIVGKVPDAFTSVFDENRNAVGDIFDYGAETTK